MKKKIRIAMVVGEVSGDYLGAGLVRELKRLFPEVELEGIAGPKLQAEGVHALFPMERLNVMGISEVLGRLPGLLRIRRSLARRWIQEPPDLFVGVDAPAFNIGLAKRLKAAGIPTVQYVSPTIWAWRAGRMKKIVQSVDLILSIFPFEKNIYRDQNIRVEYVGHPLADEIPLSNEPQVAKSALNLDGGRVLALLPGSRSVEITRLAEDFLQAALLVKREIADLQVVVPLAHEKHKKLFEKIYRPYRDQLPVKLVHEQSRLVMTAADCVLLASGTATLEATLIKKPMVVAYRLSAFTYWLAKRLVVTPYIAMPNVLAGERIVPEFVQDEVRPQALADAVIAQLQRQDRKELNGHFLRIHETLRLNASGQSAAALASFINNRGGDGAC